MIADHGDMACAFFLADDDMWPRAQPGMRAERVVICALVGARTQHQAGEAPARELVDPLERPSEFAQGRKRHVAMGLIQELAPAHRNVGA